MKVRKNVWKSARFSVIAVIILVLVNMWTMVLPDVKADEGGGGADDIMVLEAEEICYNGDEYNPPTCVDGQKIYENDLEVIRGNVYKGYKFFNKPVDLSSGTYKYYIKARSTGKSTIDIGVYTQSTPPVILLSEEFLITKQYRWYISEDFVISEPLSVKVWATSSCCVEYIDKIILVRWKDAGDNPISGTLGQIIDTNSDDSDDDGIIDDDEFNGDCWWLEGITAIDH